MRQHRTTKEAIAQKIAQVTLFTPIKPKSKTMVMRPGKTKKDKERLHKRRDTPA